MDGGSIRICIFSIFSSRHISFFSIPLYLPRLISLTFALASNPYFEVLQFVASVLARDASVLALSTSSRISNVGYE